MKKFSPVLLLIVDGWGYTAPNAGNALWAASTPNLDWVWENYPLCLLKCSGRAVGLPEGQMGNSEVGHLNIGAGRVVYQDILRIDQAIEDGLLEEIPVLHSLLRRVKANDSSLHLMGLLSDGGVHSHVRHLYALLEVARRFGLKNINVHAFLDGRDTSPWAGLGHVRDLQDKLQALDVGRIATLCGRYYAMDRDKHWSRTKAAYNALVHGEGDLFQDPVQAVQSRYDQGISDEFLPPSVLVDSRSQPVALLKDDDGVFFFNFRADRARQLAAALSQKEFSGFERGRLPGFCGLVSMTDYERELDLEVAFAPVNLENILGQVCAQEGIKQIRLAETEKYAHVTYFFNGGREKPFAEEDRILVPSPRSVATYDQKPEMSVFEVTEKLVSVWQRGLYSFVVCNFANLDMVGHTGNFQAAVQACSAVDQCLGQVLQLFRQGEGTLILTADHGNAECMLSEEQKPYTAHSKNPVPLFLIRGQGRAPVLREQGILADIAPTVLNVWNLPAPREMTGESLLQSGETDG